MYRIEWELADERGLEREAGARSCALSTPLSSALAQYAEIVSRHTFRLSKASLLEFQVNGNEWQLARTLARYEREGL
jgi:hypothetical protein